MERWARHPWRIPAGREARLLWPGQVYGNPRGACRLPESQLLLGAMESYSGGMIHGPKEKPRLGGGQEGLPHLCTHRLRLGGWGGWTPSERCADSPHSGLWACPQRPEYSFSAAWWCPGSASVDRQSSLPFLPLTRQEKPGDAREIRSRHCMQGAQVSSCPSSYHMSCQVPLRTTVRELPGGPVVRTLHFHCHGPGFNPWPGNY